MWCVAMSEISEGLKYYNFDKAFSYNAVYNFIIGARGLGKTYGAKKQVIKNFISRGDQFIYLRRYRTELVGRGTFFADIAHEFPDYMFRVDGSRAQIAKAPESDKAKPKWETMGYFIALSNAQAQKSVAYPKVKIIIFDEFIIEKGMVQYLPNESKAFNDFFSTVDRWQDKTRVLFLANAVSVTNPYFLAYEIRPDGEIEYLKIANGFILVHFADSAEFSKGVYRTRFGQFIEGSEYAEYSVGSQFSDNHDRMLGFKPSEARYYCTIETKYGYFSVWIDYSGPFYYIQGKRPKKGETVYTLLPEKMGDGKLLMVYSDKIMQYLRASFKNGKVWFDTPTSRTAFTEVFKR